MKKLSVALGAILAAGALLYAAWWWATAIGAAEALLEFGHTALFGWIQLDGWRRWYAIGGAITYVMVLARVVPPVLRWAWRELRPSFTGVLVGIPVVIVVFFAAPLIATIVIVVAWPLVVYWLAVDACTTLRKGARSQAQDGTPAG